MGVVYKADDLRLERVVALKFLPEALTADPGARERFVREAKAASALQHNNICTVHDIDEADDGRLFIVMDLYHGVTLERRLQAGPMELAEALNIAGQAAQGLKEAHARGIVHRDIKPGNILITNDGVVKILDFGLAKLKAPTSLTRDGLTLGTPAYMSPEQARGGDVTSQSDLWSLGVVLYEMLAGRPPFAGDYDAALYYSIIGQEPTPIAALRPDLPEGVSALLERALRKEPEERYQGMQEFIAGLASVSRGAVPDPSPAGRRSPGAGRRRRVLPLVAALVVIAAVVALLSWPRGETTTIRSLAVLPLRATSGTAEAEPFADGMSEALITELSRVPGLVVKSWTSVRQYRQLETSLPAVARELDADAIIEGSTELRGGRVGIRVRLIRASPEQQLWAQEYVEDFRDVLALESQIARAIVREVRGVVTPEERARLSTARPVNAQAQMAYFLGRYQWNMWTPEGFARSLTFFREAIAIDSSYALGWAGVADVFGMRWYMGLLPFDSVRPYWQEAARKAVELDARSGEARVSLAATRLAYAWDWPGAEEEMLRGLELSPGYATGHHWYALMLSAMGRHQEARSKIQTARELNPRSAILQASAGWTELHAGSYDRAREAFTRALTLDSLSAPAHSGLAEIHELTGNDEEALSHYLRVVALTGGSFSTLRGTVPEAEARLRNAYRRAGWKGYWTEQLAQLSGNETAASAYHLASIYARLGKTDEAFRWLDEAVADRSTYLLFVNVDPVVRGLRGDPRFARILETIELSPARGPRPGEE